VRGLSNTHAFYLAGTGVQGPYVGRGADRHRVRDNGVADLVTYRGR